MKRMAGRGKSAVALGMLLSGLVLAGCVRASSGPVAAKPVSAGAQASCAPAAERAPAVRNDWCFNQGWRFIQADVAGASERGFDDSGWRGVDPPHDWSIEGPFSQEFASGTGYLPGGIGWYRKTFRLPKELAGRRVRIEFGGVYKHSEVWCNGVSLGWRPYGYISFGYDLTPHLKPAGKPNVIAVRVDHSDYADSRWYTGSGIYRNVRLVVTNAVHVKRHGVFITTPRVSPERATVRVKTLVAHTGDSSRNATLASSVFGPGGALLAQAETRFIAVAGDEQAITQSIEIPKPLLWAPDHPHLYQLYSEVRTEEGVLDDTFTSFGIRRFHFEPDKGFFLNGVPAKLKGLCIHHDAGALGAAVPARVWERRLRIFKELGCNAIRMSHNPPASNLLDLCDRMGFLVMNEAFDEWNGCKRKWVEGWNKGTPSLQGYGRHFKEWADADLRELVLRDRNHPSVILWSIGNEIDYVNDPHPPNAEYLVPIAKRLVRIVKSLDPTRPVTAALASPETNLFVDCLDVVGYNYHEELYEKHHALYPERVLYGSENGKGLKSWRAVEQNDFIAGLHLWTGIDFLGEAAAWPWRNSRAGLLDLAGFKKPSAWFWQSLWADEPMVHLRLQPAKAEEAQPVLLCYTNCETVELTRNGKSLGEKRLAGSPDRVLRWEVGSADAAFTAEGKVDGAVACSAEWRAPGAPERLDVRVDRETLVCDGRDVAHVEVRVVDANGVRVPDAEHEVTCAVTGPARLIGMESGNARSHEDYTSNRRKTYQGRLLLYIQAKHEPGEVELRLVPERLPPARVSLRTERRSP